MLSTAPSNVALQTAMLCLASVLRPVSLRIRRQHANAQLMLLGLDDQRFLLHKKPPFLNIHVTPLPSP